MLQGESTEKRIKPQAKKYVFGIGFAVLLLIVCLLGYLWATRPVPSSALPQEQSVTRITLTNTTITAGKSAQSVSIVTTDSKEIEAVLKQLNAVSVHYAPDYRSALRLGVAPNSENRQEVEVSIAYKLGTQSGWYMQRISSQGKIQLWFGTASKSVTTNATVGRFGKGQIKQRFQEFSTLFEENQKKSTWSIQTYS